MGSSGGFPGLHLLASQCRLLTLEGWKILLVVSFRFLHQNEGGSPILSIAAHLVSIIEEGMW
ncbi:MAG: hypothetical protein WD595_05675 [Waddliaceae bacterium]